MKRLYFLPAILWLTSCASLTRSDYQRPLLSLPQQWQQKAAQDNARMADAPDLWWRKFDDPRLTRVVEHVLQSNSDLASAMITVRQARSAADLTDTNLTPEVTVSGSADNSRYLRNAPREQRSYSAGLSLSYELDVWGKLARTREQSAWQASASEQDYQALVLTTIDTTAQLYWHIALINQQIKNVIASQAIASKTQAQVTSWYHAGKVGQTDVLQAQQTLISRQNQRRSLEQQRDNARNALALLLNRPAEQHVDEAPALDSMQTVPIALTTPLAVIARRPDIQAAESRLRAALAGSDAARLSFYPSLSLDAALNAGSQIFTQWFHDPVRTVGGSVALPFIQWNTVQLTIAQADLQVQQAAIAFRHKAYTALAEVDNAMEQRLSAEEQRTRLQQSLRLSQQRLRLTQSRYQAGAVDYQTLLNAQEALLTQENDLAQIQYDYLYATLQLWLAQGGGDVQQRTTEHAAQ